MSLLQIFDMLVVNAKRDEVFPAARARSLFDLAKQPKKNVWYNTSHYMPPKKYNRAVLEWLERHL
jgi:fermentation-respiration switch protein FrsA (DUF1100 family)